MSNGTQRMTLAQLAAQGGFANLRSSASGNSLRGIWEAAVAAQQAELQAKLDRAIAGQKPADRMNEPRKPRKTQPASQKSRKAAPKPPTEHEEQVFLLQWVEASKARLPELEMLFAIPNGAKLPYRRVTKKGVAISHERTKMLKEGMRPGVPDLMIAVARRDYYGLFIELKRAKKSLSVVSDEQKKWIEKLTARGYLAVICYGAEEAKAVILDYLGVE